VTAALVDAVHETRTWAVKVPSDALTPDGAATFRQPKFAALSALSPASVVARTEYL